MIRRRPVFGRLSRWMEQDRGLKVLAVAIAVLLWVQAVADRNPIEERTFANLPVRYTEADPGLVAVSCEPPAINLVARGRVAVLQKVAKEDFQVYVDLGSAGAGSGEHEIRVSPPRGVEVAQISQETATVRLDWLAERELPLRVVVRGTPAAGHATREAVASPATVIVAGAESRLERVHQAVVEIDASGAASDLSRQAPVQVLAAGGEPVTGLKVTPATAEVTLPVFRLPDPITLPVNVRLEGIPYPGYEVAAVQATPAEVRISADPARLKDLRWVQTAAVSVEGRRETFSRTVALERPPGAYVVDPPQVAVRVEMRPATTTRSLAGVPVGVVNLAAHLQPVVTPERVLVTVRGGGEELAALEESAIRVTVDAAGLGPGTHLLPVQVSLPSGLTLERVEPEEVTVAVRSP